MRKYSLCCPVFVPQMVGGAEFPGLETENESSKH